MMAFRPNESRSCIDWPRRTDGRGHQPFREKWTFIFFRCTFRSSQQWWVRWVVCAHRSAICLADFVKRRCGGHSVSAKSERERETQSIQCMAYTRNVRQAHKVHAPNAQIRLCAVQWAVLFSRKLDGCNFPACRSHKRSVVSFRTYDQAHTARRFFQLSTSFRLLQFVYVLKANAPCSFRLHVC